MAGRKKSDVLVSSDNTTTLSEYENGNIETRLTFSETYVGRWVQDILFGRNPASVVDTVHRGGFNITAGIGLAGFSANVVYDALVKQTTIELSGALSGLGIDGTIILDEDLNVINSDTDLGFKMIAGLKGELIGVVSAGAEAEFMLGIEFENGRVAINAEGEASIGLIVGEIDAEATTDVEIVDFNEDYCFAAGTPIEMADGTTKPIEDIAIDDMVLAFDGDVEQGRGAKVAKRVTQLHRTENQVVFDFHGLRVTSGHAFLTGDGDFKPVIEILEEDGTVVLSDGKTVCARTGWPVGSDKDRAIPVGCPMDDKVEILTMRAGTLYGVKEGIALTIQEMMKSRGYHLRTDGRFVNVEGDVKTAFWEWGMPEDKMIAGKRASYDDLIEGSIIATGMPLMPSRPN